MQDSKDKVAFNNTSNNEKLFELDKEFAEFFIQNLPSELNKLKHVCEQNDHSGMKFQAHKMAPTLKMMNSEKAADLLKALSKFEGNAEQAQEIAAQAIMEVETAISCLQQA